MHSTPELQSITDGRAFYSMSTYRDLVFHVQEHQHTLPEICEMLAVLDLEFLGFEHTDPTIPGRYRQRFPQDPVMTDLELWHRFELDNPTTFENCYRFCVYKPAAG